MMKKRFKRRKTIFNYKKIGLFILCILTSIYITYKSLYNFYISKLSNKEIISYIIKNTKNNTYKGTLLDKYLKPENIIGEQFDINVSEVMTVEKEEIKEPLVYIYSTHETESYEDSYLELYNIKPTVKNMSYILKDYLNEQNINVIIENESVTEVLRKNNWSYKKSYDASRQLITPTINNNPTFKLIIDLHRDSSPLSKTLLEYENKKYAKILFVIGKNNKNYQDNYQVSSTLQVLLENKIPGITRGITIKEGEGVNGIYNQDINSNIVLIELGGQYNEIEELNNTLEILSIVIREYIGE